MAGKRLGVVFRTELLIKAQSKCREGVRRKAGKVEVRRKIIQFWSTETTKRNGEKTMNRCGGGAKLDCFLMC